MEGLDYDVNGIYNWNLECMGLEVCKYIDLYFVYPLSESYIGFVTR